MYRISLIFFFLCTVGGVSAQPSFTVRDGIPYVDSSLPISPLWFADSRLAFSFDGGGVGQIDYYSPIANQNLATFFLRQLWDGFRYYLVTKDGKRYKPVFKHSTIWPFGIESEWQIGSAVIRHRVMAVDESIVIQITTPDNMPEGTSFSLEFYEAFGLSRGSDDDLRYTNGDFTRQWSPWVFDPAANSLTGLVRSLPKPDAEKRGVPPFDTYCTIGADFPLTHTPRGINPKHMLASAGLGHSRTYSYVISFANQDDIAKQRNRQQVEKLSQLVGEQFARYRRVADECPVLESPYTSLNDFIRLAPLYHESLKVRDVPGTVRAKTTNYWIWAWDDMTCNEASFYWADTAYMRKMLEFFEVTADSVKGIGHAYGFDSRPTSISALPAQGMYISLLQLYYEHTGDTAALRKHYAFARTVFNRMAAKEIAGTGMSEGSSEFPDFPEAMEETGKDISGFNNTIYYAAVRSMEWLAGLLEDKQQQQKAAAIGSRIEKHFVPLFFDKKRGFVVSSIDAVSLRQRDSYNINSIRWENNYCGDLTYPIDSACLSFFENNAITPMGIREAPVWGRSYDKDANQLHCWWPATGEYFVRLVNQFDKPAMIDEWISWVSYWTRHLSCPEGISNYIETNEPEFDRWTSQQGAWQAYSTRAWYQETFHSVVGVDTDPGGITLYPYSGKEMTLRNLYAMGRRFDLFMKGSGPYIDSILVDGEKLLGTHKIPVDSYNNDPHPVIVVYRSKIRTRPLTIVTANAIELDDFHFDGKTVRALISGIGKGSMRICADHLPVVIVKDRKMPVVYDVQTKEAFVEFTNLGKREKIYIK